jgi:hypothetical protein
MSEPVSPGGTKSITILEEANKATSVSRNKAYGHPAANHSCTARLWRAYIERRFGVDLALTAEDVCMLNILQKVSREAHGHTRDNLVDIAGYARNVEMIRQVSVSVPPTQTLRRDLEARSSDLYSPLKD